MVLTEMRKETFLIELAPSEFNIKNNFSDTSLSLSSADATCSGRKVSESVLKSPSLGKSSTDSEFQELF